MVNYQSINWDSLRYLWKRLGRVGKVIGLGECPKVEEVLGVHAARHVDVELQQLQELPLQLVPTKTVNINFGSPTNADFFLVFAHLKMIEMLEISPTKSSCQLYWREIGIFLFVEQKFIIKYV